MATIETTPAAPPTVPVAVPAPAEIGEKRFLISSVSWEGYLAIADALGDHSGVRMTYDRGRLELMSPGRAHESWKSRITRLLECAAEELGLSVEIGGSTTFRREDLDRGLEPDDCYWIGSVSLARGKQSWDSATDPPPDLVVEIEMRPGSLDRLAIYAALGVSEVWRFDGHELRYEILVDGKYVVGQSRAFPQVAASVFAGFANPANHPDHMTMIRSFRLWLRDLPT